jgi:adenine-specific DNA-methyltransferase
VNLEEFNLDPALGQVWTPQMISEEMMMEIKPFARKDSKILDPACGPGTFFMAAKKCKIKFDSFHAFEVDERLIKFLQGNEQFADQTLQKHDFITFDHGNDEYDIAVLNPPYIRHELIDEKHKNSISDLLFTRTAKKFTRRTNYYGYFLVLTAEILKPGGIMCAIVYDSLKSTRYGQEILDYLSSSGEIISRRIVSTPFENTMIDAEIILWKKHDVRRVEPLELMFEVDNPTKEGFCLASDLAIIKRGTSFLKREYFVRKHPDDNLKYMEMVTKQSLSTGLQVEPNAFGLFKTDSPTEDTALLVNLRKKYQDPKLETIVSLPSPVYGDILFNYFIRDNARHLINENHIPASDNFYCITPKNPEFRVAHWVIANSSQYIQNLINASRGQGSGLRKLQMFEYANSLFPDYRKFTSVQNRAFESIGRAAINESWKLSDLQAISTNQLVNIGFPIE